MGNIETKVTKVSLNQPICDNTSKEDFGYCGSDLQNLPWGGLFFPPLGKMMLQQHKNGTVPPWTQREIFFSIITAAAIT